MKLKYTNRTISLILITALLTALLTGCGKAEAKEEITETEADSVKTNVETEEAVLTYTEGNTLNIYCWNDEFKNLLEDNYPDYEEVDTTHGMIGNVEVVWNIIPTDDNAYQTSLDEHLMIQGEVPTDDRIDIFLIEASYAPKYVYSNYSLSVEECGITSGDVANQYPYTRDIATDPDGVLKGVSWQACPGALIYNREAAREVLGSDDPATVQDAVKDWDSFLNTADNMYAAGYKMVSSPGDLYRVFSNNVNSKWVDNGTISIDSEIKKWVDITKYLIDKDYVTTADVWSDEWKKGLYPEGKVFCYFVTDWIVDNCMAASVKESIANQGGWGIVKGPQGFFWGGTWICAAEGTDNPELAGDIMKQLACNKDIMNNMVLNNDDFVNNITVMSEMSDNEMYSSSVYGGVNPLSVYCELAETIKLPYISYYDEGCNELFRKAMKNYFEDNASYEEALEIFRNDIIEKYPELIF